MKEVLFKFPFTSPGERWEYQGEKLTLSKRYLFGLQCALILIPDSEPETFGHVGAECKSNAQFLVLNRSENGTQQPYTLAG